MKRIVGAIVIIAVMMTLFAACSYSFESGESSGSSNQKGETSIDASELKELKVNVGVGNVTISKSPNKNAEIKYKKNVRGSSEHVKEVADSIQVVTECVGDKLLVEVKTNDGESEDLWQWLSKKYKNINVSVDIDMEIPDNIVVIDVNDGVGAIDIKDLKGRYSVVCGVGNIKMKGASFKDKCEVTVGTGDIELDCEIVDTNNLSVQTGVGNIVIRMPKDAGFDLDAAAGVGTINGNLITPNKDSFVGDTLKQRVNGGGTGLELTAGTGNITIDKN